MVNEVTLNYMRQVAQHAIDVVANVYIPDIKAIASFYPDWFKYGKGLAGINMMSYGDFPEIANDYSDKSIQIPRGAILNGNLNEVFDVDTRDPEQVQEFVDHSWYKYPEADKGLHPWDGITDQHYELPPGSDGTETKFNWLAPDGKYSWDQEPALARPHDGSGPACPYGDRHREERSAL